MNDKKEETLEEFKIKINKDRDLWVKIVVFTTIASIAIFSLRDDLVMVVTFGFIGLIVILFEIYWGITQ